jgi:hypothetical protein
MVEIQAVNGILVVVAEPVLRELPIQPTVE